MLMKPNIAVKKDCLIDRVLSFRSYIELEKPLTPKTEASSLLNFLLTPEFLPKTV